MNKRDLESALEKVFFNDWSPSMPTVMNKLHAVVSYYSDSEEFTEDLRTQFNRLSEIVLATDYIEVILNKVRSDVPHDFRCDFMLDRPGNNGPAPSSLSFSPNITVPDMPQELGRELIAESKRILSRISEIDFASLVAFVKRRAVACGDITFGE